MTEYRPKNPAKAFLGRYRALLARRRSMERSVDELRERLTGTTVQLKADVVSSSGSGDVMADTVAKIADMEAQMAEQLAEIDAALAEVLEAIASVRDELQRTVLTLRYVEGLPWAMIQVRLAYEQTQVFVIHGRALASVNEWMGSRK